jgi:glutathione S-transferase
MFLADQELHEMYDTADAALCVRRWAALEAGMDALAAYIDNTSHSDTSLFGMGSEPVYADFLLAGMLLWMEAAGPEDGWDKMKGWNGGMWVAAYERCRPYMQVL